MKHSSVIFIGIAYIAFIGLMIIQLLFQVF